MDFRSKYIVSDEYRFVYFLVQKFACTSIKTALAPLFGIDTTRAEERQEDANPRFLILPHILRSARGPDYRESYAGHTAALTGERYEKDADVFGYAS